MRGHSDLAGNKVKKSLMELMGTDEVRLNDPDFMKRLTEKIDEDYKNSERQKMRHLQEEERKRERKLALEGITEGEHEHNRERKKWSDYRQHKTEKEEDYFEENAFESPPAGNYSLKERMRRDMEEKRERQERVECQNDEDNEEDGENKEKKENNGDEEKADKENGDNEEEKGDAPKDGERGGEDGEGGERNGDHSSEQAKEGAHHPCAFVNRPYSARVERLIEEETLEGLMELAKELVFVGTK